MSVDNEMNVGPKRRGAGVLRPLVAAILLVLLAIVFVGGVFWYQDITSIPSVTRQAEEVAALETHVLPLVKDLRATWFLNERFGTDSIHWSRGRFTNDPARASQDGDSVFDPETKESFERLSRAIRSSGVPTNRLREAVFADDGTVRTASFQRRGGGPEFVLTYIFSPGAKPREWTSNLGPVVLTRIGDTDWWFEQSPDD